MALRYWCQWCIVTVASVDFLHQAVLSHEHHDQCSKKRNSKRIFDLRKIDTNKLYTTFPENDHCKQTTSFSPVTTSNAGFLSWPACQGFHLGGPISRLQHPTQPDIWRLSCQLLDQHESQGKICNCFKRKVVFYLITCPTTTGFPAFLAHLIISAICSFMKSRVLDTNLAMLHDYGWSFMIQTPSLAKVEVLCASRCNTRAAAATRSAPAEPWRKVSMKCS